MVSEHASPLATIGGVDAGGQNVHVAALGTELARRGHRVVVFTRRDHPGLPERVEMRPNLTVRHVDAGPPEAIPKDELLPHMPEFGRQLLRAWSEERPDVVHAHFWMSGLAALDACEPLELPLAMTFHALGVVKRRHQGRKDTSPAERIEQELRLARSSSVVIATCTDEVFELARMGIRVSRVRVVPCGVDLELFTSSGPAEPRRPGLRRVVIVTRLVERKGVGNVIEALADVPDTELVVAGGCERGALGRDPEASRLLRIARARGVADRVQLLGAIGRPSVPPLLRSADVVACVPWYEPFGIVPLEAAACGVPVVASAVGGLIDTVVDGVTGVHVPPRCPERIAEALRDVLDDDARRTRLGAAAALRARRYSWSRIADATLRAYATVSAPAERPAEAVL
ncbi:MAG TPA: glycosyltransferase [Gaiella sp.]|jgi:glycosyltransferase involved in cell wall biosynthesis|nr:glycosyltransferase [Gaiella sp.]